MLCESCQQRDAKYHLTHVAEGVVQKMHLCEECADKKGINIPSSMSLNDILAGMQQDESLVPSDASKSCAHCGMTQSDFKAKQRLGCPRCYAAFGLELTPLLESMHKGARHIGKVPAHAATEAKLAVELANYRDELADLIAAEKYEDAARVRDQLHRARERLRKLTRSSEGSVGIA